MIFPNTTETSSTACGFGNEKIGANYSILNKKLTYRAGDIDSVGKTLIIGINY